MSSENFDQSGPATEAGPATPEAQGHQRFSTATQTDEALAAAQAAIAEGRCIVLPTDTVYGIGSDAFSAEAVQGLLDAKHRGRDMPPPVLVAETAMLEALADDVPTQAMALAERFWPGALTLIVQVQPHLRIDLGETHGTIAVRVPDHEFTRDLLRRTGPLAVSSANVSGQPASTDIDDAEQQLGDSVAVYLDDGPTPGPTPSTIIDFVSNPLGAVVRLGALGVEELREVDPFLVVPEQDEPEPVPAPAEGAAPEQQADGPAGQGSGATAVEPPTGAASDAADPQHSVQATDGRVDAG